ncbi:hypothetical protein FHR56_002923 [Xanthomonas sacchari]|uniref:hypothetical protein n=1 Tax=unclassified Xanthomonas TaxID=2643310 RepID=UPI0017FDA32B|nr:MULTISPECIES: hypothetical protein [unclassified Xanthomonas]MBB6367758.1 hypothetical protein [Xanthomonas sp. F10]
MVDEFGAAIGQRGDAADAGRLQDDVRRTRRRELTLSDIDLIDRNLDACSCECAGGPPTPRW